MYGGSWSCRQCRWNLCESCYGNQHFESSLSEERIKSNGIFYRLKCDGCDSGIPSKVESDFSTRKSRKNDLAEPLTTDLVTAPITGDLKRNTRSMKKNNVIEPLGMEGVSVEMKKVVFRILSEQEQKGQFTLNISELWNIVKTKENKRIKDIAQLKEIVEALNND